MNTTTAATAAESFVEDYAYNRLGGAGREDSAKSAAFSAVISGGMGASFYAVGQAARNMCFVEGTMVLTAEGLVAIESIAVGDMVIATDPETGETAEKEVKNTFVNETEELAHVFVNGEEIVCTPGHKFYAPEKGWTSAIELRAGDQLQLVNGKYVTVEKVQHELLEEPVKVYNFEVEDFHTYYVGTDVQVLVHNECLDETNTQSNGVKNSDIPKWRQSEIDAADSFPGYKPQQSFLNGESVKYGTKGSVRPDYYSYEKKHSVDVKNYNVTNSRGRNKLAKNIEKQYYQRLRHLPENTKQTVFIDVRGQNVSEKNLRSLYDSIMRRTKKEVEVIFQK